MANMNTQPSIISDHAEDIHGDGKLSEDSTLRDTSGDTLLQSHSIDTTAVAANGIETPNLQSVTERLNQLSGSIPHDIISRPTDTHDDRPEHYVTPQDKISDPIDVPYGRIEPNTTPQDQMFSPTDSYYDQSEFFGTPKVQPLSATDTHYDRPELFATPKDQPSSPTDSYNSLPELFGTPKDQPSSPTDSHYHQPKLYPTLQDNTSSPTDTHYSGPEHYVTPQDQPSSPTDTHYDRLEGFATPQDQPSSPTDTYYDPSEHQTTSNDRSSSPTDAHYDPSMHQTTSNDRSSSPTDTHYDPSMHQTTSNDRSSSPTDTHYDRPQRYATPPDQPSTTTDTQYHQSPGNVVTNRQKTRASHDNASKALINETRKYDYKGPSSSPHPDEDCENAYDEKTSLLPGSKPRTYAVRWYVLWLFCMVTVLQGIGFGTFGPITQSCKAVFGWHDYNVALMGTGGCAFFAICCIPFSWIMETKGLRVSMVISTALIALGFGLRCISMHAPLATWTMSAGQILTGGGAVVPASGMSMLSSLWFPLSQRATATSVATVTAFLGIALGNILGPFVVPGRKFSFHNQTHGHFNRSIPAENDTLIHEQREAISMLMYSEAAAAGLVLLLVIVYFPAKPPTPPSFSAHVERLDIRKGLHSLIRNRSFLLILVAFSITTGTYGAFSSILDIDVNSIGVSQKSAGWIGFYSIIGGCAAGFVVSWLSDRFMRKIKFFILLLMIPTAVALAVFCLFIGSYIPFHEVGLYISAIVPGVCIFGGWSLFFELACEAAYPTGEGITTVALLMFNNVIASLFLAALLVPNLGVLWMNYVLTASVVVGIIFLLVTRVQYRRTDLDAQEIIVPGPGDDDDEESNSASGNRQSYSVNVASYGIS